MFSKIARSRWSLATWLTVCYSMLSIVIVACALIYSYRVLIANLDHEDDQFVAAYLKDVESRLQDDPRELDELRSLWSAAAAQSSPVRILMRVLKTDGSILAETPRSNEVSWPPVRSLGRSNGFDANNSWRCLSMNAVSVTGEKVVLQAAIDHRQKTAILARYRKQLYLVLTIAALACAIGGVLLARRGLRPLRELSIIAAGIQANQMGERLDSSKYAVELERVATTFNGMLDRLQESFDRLSRFSGDIAHELRTPLHNLRGEVEVALTKNRSVEDYRDVLGSCLEESTRLSRLVDSLLFLARAEKPESSLKREPMELAAELATIGEFYEAAAEDAGVLLNVTCDLKLEFTADRTLFQRAIGNLVTNALAYTPRMGQVEIRGCVCSTGIDVTVSDNGSGIDSKHLPHVFDRLYRGNESRSASKGHGLGLSIVKSVVELHGGQVVIQSIVNQGTRVQTTWPIREFSKE